MFPVILMQLQITSALVFWRKEMEHVRLDVYCCFLSLCVSVSCHLCAPLWPPGSQQCPHVRGRPLARAGMRLLILNRGIEPLSGARGRFRSRVRP